MDASTGIKRRKKKPCADCGKPYKRSTGFCSRCYKKSCDAPDFSSGGACACGISKPNHKPPMATETLRSIVSEGQASRVPIEQVVPNRWNPNTMPEDRKAKLWLGMVRVLQQQAQAGEAAPRLPPIIVRQLPPGREHKYEIIDGEQRWKLLKDNQDHELVQRCLPGVIDIVVINVDDTTARLLTSTMNWLHGDADADRYVDMLSDIWKAGMTTEQMSELLPESAGELTAIAENYGIKIEEVTIAQDDLDKSIANDTREDLHELKFSCYAQQSEVIMGAISRVGSLLTGKNVLARALELICAESLGTPVESFAEKIKELYPPEPEKSKKRGSLKEKLAKKAKKSSRAKAAESNAP